MGIYIVRHYWDQSGYFRQQTFFGGFKQKRVLPTNQKMVFGVGTFMAWIAGVIQMIGGGIMLAQSCGNEEEEYDGNDSQYGGYQQGIVKGNTGGAGRIYV